ncbi:hypothetical protein [Propionibacterium acidifaciens]|uniref:hypothetical protein n=1 Tax=Propionibacterium acidifaciens TaxID=556499 RepID=UPI0028EF9515|nr:hypothetical protein [Propionibacterium acidifaciens]
MPNLMSQIHPNLLVTSPRIEFSDGTASCDTELTDAQLAHLATVGVTLADKAPEGEPEAGVEDSGEAAEAAPEPEQAALRRRRKTDG